MKSFFFFGDSLTLGVNDPSFLGWVNRFMLLTSLPVPPTTVYNLGARKHSSKDIAARWQQEVACRTLQDADTRIMFSFGVVDMVANEAGTLVGEKDSVHNLRCILQQAKELYGAGNIIVMSPLPVKQPAHQERILQLGQAYSAACAELDIAYIDIATALLQTSGYIADLADNVHPAAAGCTCISQLLWQNPLVQRWAQQ